MGRVVKEIGGSGVSSSKAWQDHQDSAQWGCSLPFKKGLKNIKLTNLAEGFWEQEI